MSTDAGAEDAPTLTKAPPAPAAEAAAMQECAARRLRMRQQAQCQLYAVGDEIVWPGP